MAYSNSKPIAVPPGPVRLLRHVLFLGFLVAGLSLGLAADTVSVGSLDGADYVVVTVTERQEEIPAAPPSLDGAIAVLDTADLAVGLDEPTAKAPAMRTVTERSEEWEGDAFLDIVTTPDGGLLVCGVLQHRDAIPAGVPVHALAPGEIGRGTVFVARFTTDAAAMEWIAVLPGGLLEPDRLAVLSDGAAVLGGHVTDAAAMAKLPEVTAGTDWQTGPAVLLCIAPDGQQRRWVRRAAPNMADITGLATTPDDRILYTGSTTGRQMSAYLLQVSAAGEQIDFPKANDGQKPNWAISLHPNDPQLKTAYFAFYKQGTDGWHDYDGEGGWGKTRFSLHGFRRGGQIVLLSDGDMVVSASLQYDFRVEGQKGFPAFDLLLARYSADGVLRWATNLYRPGDGVHTPDQIPLDLTYHAATDTLYLLAKQHGSNVYRLRGHLDGDTGNTMIAWLGKVDAIDGTLQAGWYHQNNRSGNYRSDGRPASPPHPALAGSILSRVRVGSNGTVWVAGYGAAKMWTTPDAHQAWPSDWNGGGAACLLALSPDLAQVRYATTFHGGQTGSAFSGLVLHGGTIVAVGQGHGSTFPSTETLPWSTRQPDGLSALLVRFVLPLFTQEPATQ